MDADECVAPVAEAVAVTVAFCHVHSAGVADASVDDDLFAVVAVVDHEEAEEAAGFEEWLDVDAGVAEGGAPQGGGGSRRGSRR